MHGVLRSLWSNRLAGVVTMVVVVAAAGLFSAWLTPRGPVTTVQALVSMAAALAVGLASGLLLRSRWSLLAGPAVFVLVFELARLGVAGPTVDGIHLGSTYGVIAFILGRLLHGVLVLVPMIVGALYGIGVAARKDGSGRTRLRAAGWTVTGLLTLGVLVFAAFLARPADIAPIQGPDGETLSGSVAELIAIPIGGHDQALMIRGRSTDNPVLLYLAGGPGGTDLGAMRADVSLEEDFVVAVWEQRGVGKSYAALDPVETLTVDQALDDTIEVARYLCDRFREEKIYLVGNSWGTILGTLAVQQRPELFHAFVGTGPMVSPRETDIMFYEDTLAWAEQTGDEKLVATLRTNGPPPYESLLDYEPALSREHDWNAYPRVPGVQEMPGNLLVPENTLMDKINGMRSFLDTFSILYPQLQTLDLRSDVTSLAVPYYMVLGKYEARGRAVLANEWFDLLETPSKEKIVFSRSGHRPLFEEPAEFASLMGRIRGETYVAATQ